MAWNLAAWIRKEHDRHQTDVPSLTSKGCEGSCFDPQKFLVKVGSQEVQAGSGLLAARTRKDHSHFWQRLKGQFGNKTVREA